MNWPSVDLENLEFLALKDMRVTVTTPISVNETDLYELSLKYGKPYRLGMIYSTYPLCGESESNDYHFEYFVIKYGSVSVSRPIADQHAAMSVYADYTFEYFAEIMFRDGLEIWPA